MSQYQEWFKQQPRAFQELITLRPEEVRENFVDEKYTEITLEELKELDQIYIFSEEDINENP